MEIYFFNSQYFNQLFHPATAIVLILFPVQFRTFQKWISDQMSSSKLFIKHDLNCGYIIFFKFNYRSLTSYIYIFFILYSESLLIISYTLLVGKPPFETETLKETYTRIKKNEYRIPSRIGPLARNLIMKLLQEDPDRRPNVDVILTDDFMTMGEC